VTAASRAPAPVGDLASFAAETFTHDGVAHRILRKGSGPAVIVITEMPGISRQVLGFADRVVALGCTAVLPDLFGTAGRDPLVAGLTERVARLTREEIDERFATLHEMTQFEPLPVR